MNLRFGRRCLGGVGVVVLAAGELMVALGGRSLWREVTGPGPSTLPEVLALATAGAAFILGLWLALGIAAALLEGAPGRAGALARSLASRCAPPVCRRWAALLVGASLGAGVVVSAGPGTATAAAAPGVATATTPRTGIDPLPGFSPTTGRSAAELAASSPLASQEPAGPGWTPTRPRIAHETVTLVSGPATRRPGVDRARSSSARREVVVTRGDSLWAIVQRALGPEATDAEAARAWPQWYAENRTVIGPDPGLLQPGQVLRAPERPTPSAGAAATTAAARP